MVEDQTLAGCDSFRADSKKETAERCVRLHLGILGSTLNCQGLGCLIRSAIFLDKRTATSKVGWMLSFLISPGLPPKVFQLPILLTLFAGHQLDTQCLNDNMWLYTMWLFRLERGPEKVWQSYTQMQCSWWCCFVGDFALAQSGAINPECVFVQDETNSKRRRIFNCTS